MQRTVGTIKAHHFSGLIHTVAIEVECTEADAKIADLYRSMPLSSGSFYAYHAERLKNTK